MKAAKHNPQQTNKFGILDKCVNEQLAAKTEPWLQVIITKFPLGFDQFLWRRNRKTRKLIVQLKGDLRRQDPISESVTWVYKSNTTRSFKMIITINNDYCILLLPKNVLNIPHLELGFQMLLRRFTAFAQNRSDSTPHDTTLVRSAAGGRHSNP